MKVSTPRSSLLSALSHVAGIVGKGGSHMAASCALLTADKAGLTVRATDGVSIDIRVVVAGAEVSAPGAIMVPAKDMLDRVKAMPDGASVDLAMAGDKLAIKSKGDRRFTLRTLPAENMPAWPKRGDESAVTLPSSVVASALACVSHSMSTDSSQPACHGALLAFDGTTFSADAADGGKRIAVYDHPFIAAGSFSALVSFRGIGVIERTMAGAESAEIAKSGTQLFVEAGAVTLAINTVAAAFPATRLVLKSIVAKASGEASRALLLDAVRSVGLAALGPGRPILLTMAGGSLRLLGKGEGGEESADTVAYVPAVDSADAETLCPGEQLADALAASSAEAITVAFSTPKDGQCSPLLLTAEHAGGSAKFVIMSSCR